MDFWSTLRCSLRNDIRWDGWIDTGAEGDLRSESRPRSRVSVVGGGGWCHIERSERRTSLEVRRRERRRVERDWAETEGGVFEGWRGELPVESSRLGTRRLWSAKADSSGEVVEVEVGVEEEDVSLSDEESLVGLGVGLVRWTRKEGMSRTSRISARMPATTVVSPILMRAEPLVCVREPTLRWMGRG